MQIISTFGAASGSAGGLVASHGRAGPQLRARVINRQPRSASQQNARAATGSLAPLWRTLTDAQRAGWNALAASLPARLKAGFPAAQSGYSLFLGCNRNLLTPATGAPILSAAAAPSFPAIGTFTATAVLSSPAPPNSLSGFTLAWTPALPSPYIGILRASAALSPGRGNIRPSDLRVLAALLPIPALTTSVGAAWLALWGQPPLAGRVTFALNLLDPLSGFASPEVRAVAAFAVTLQPPTPGLSITVEINSVEVATLANQSVAFEGTAIVAP